MTDKCLKALQKIASGAYGADRLVPPPEPPKKPDTTGKKPPQEQPLPQNKKPHWFDRYLNNKVSKTAAAQEQKQPSIKPMTPPPGGWGPEGIYDPQPPRKPAKKRPAVTPRPTPKPALKRPEPSLAAQHKEIDNDPNLTPDEKAAEKHAATDLWNHKNYR